MFGREALAAARNEGYEVMIDRWRLIIDDVGGGANIMRDHDYRDK